MVVIELTEDERLIVANALRYYLAAGVMVTEDAATTEDLIERFLHDSA